MVGQIFVVGGSGFVGSYICKRAVEKGMKVFSLSRRGMPVHREPWHDKVNWLSGSAMDTQNAPWKQHMIGSRMVVCAVGAFGSNDFMIKVNGHCNMAIVDAALQGVTSSAQLPVFGFVSATRAAGAPSWLIPGYYKGKQMMEEKLNSSVPNHIIVKPGMVYGQRYVKLFGVTIPIPLQLLGKPLKFLLDNDIAERLERIPLLGIAMTSPAAAEDIATVMVAAANKQEPIGKIVYKSREIGRVASAENN
jgi:uncharacterized protein YbjT (DUF2867 family)